MIKLVLIIIILLYCIPAWAQTAYDSGQDRYVDGMVSALNVTIGKLELKNISLDGRNTRLERENATQETELRILMAFAGVLLLGLVLTGWQIIKTTKTVKKLGVGVFVLFALLAVGCASRPVISDNSNEPIVICQGCPAYRCNSHWQCQQIGCRFCELRRGMPYPFSCR